MAEKLKHKHISWIRAAASVLCTCLLAIWWGSPTHAAQSSSDSVSVSVTASVGLSDYFAELVATTSTVEPSLDENGQVVLTVQIRSTDGLVFSGHPLVVSLITLATDETVRRLPGVTASQGLATFPLEALQIEGFYKVRVTDWMYDKPIVLAREPVIYLGDRSGHDSYITQTPGVRYSASIQPPSRILRGHSIRVTVHSWEDTYVVRLVVESAARVFGNSP